MAFCNSCGTTLAPGAQFCSKCGAAVAPVSAIPGATPAPTPAQKGGSSAVKVILIVVAVIVVIGVLGLATLWIIAYKVAKNTRVNQEGDRVKVETPIGTFSANDPEQAVKDLGVDVYPGAQVQKNGSASATFGNLRTVTANFTSSDSVDKICAFYKSKFPAFAVKSSDQNHCSIVSNDPQNAITINIQASGDGSMIQIASVNKKASN